MKDMNEFRLSGTVERFDQINTRTGTPMIAFTVMCWKERVRCVAFKSIAEQTNLAAGDRVECRGHIQSNSWTDQNGQQRTGWQVIAHEITRADDAGQQQEQPRPPRRQHESQQGNLFPDRRRPDTGKRHQYTGGPF